MQAPAVWPEIYSAEDAPARHSVADGNVRCDCLHAQRPLTTVSESHDVAIDNPTDETHLTIERHPQNRASAGGEVKTSVSAAVRTLWRDKGTNDNSGGDRPVPMRADACWRLSRGTSDVKP
jgi:hypothetical protein